MRWIAQSMYAAARITPSAEIVVISGYVLKEPSITRNSAMKPLVPGSPMLESVTMVRSVAKTGTTFAIPPYAEICRVCRRS